MAGDCPIGMSNIGPRNMPQGRRDSVSGYWVWIVLINILLKSL